MKDLLITTLTELGYPIIQQGSLGDNPYPSAFFTFWNNEVSGESFYDNNEHSFIWNFDLNFYAEDPSLVNSVLVSAKALLKRAGFSVYGKGYDVMSDEPTHTGRGINVMYFEQEGEDQNE